MDFELEEAYQDMIRFSYTSFDRMVIRGFVPIMQRPGGFVGWAQDLRPGEAIEDSWIQSLARRFHEGVKTFARERGIPILRPVKGEKKRKRPVNPIYRARLQSGIVAPSSFAEQRHESSVSRRGHREGAHVREPLLRADPPGVEAEGTGEEDGDSRGHAVLVEEGTPSTGGVSILRGTRVRTGDDPRS